MQCVRTSWTRRRWLRCSSRSPPSSSSRAKIRSASVPSAPPRGPSAASRATCARAWRTASSPATKGVGPATLQIVAEIVATGRASMLEELREQIPPGLVEMLAISGLGVAKIRQIHEVLDIDSLPELEAAALDGRLAKLPRFGPKTSENILKGIAYLRQASAFRLLHHAARRGRGAARRAGAAARRGPAPIVAGDVRRRAEVVRDLVLVLVADVVARRAVQAAEPAARRPRVRRAGRAPAHAPVRRRRERADRGRPRR